MKRLLEGLALLLILGLLPTDAWAAEASSEGESAEAKSLPPLPPERRLYLSDLSLLRWNPLGVETQNRLMYQKRLSSEPSVLFGNTFVAAGLSLKLNPAYVKVGPLLELQPIALLHLRAGYEYFYYFGSFGYLQSYNDPSADYSDAARDLTKDGSYSTSGHHVLFEPTFQLAIKKVAVRSRFYVEFWDMTLKEGDTVFYDPTLDTQVPGKGWVFANDTDLLYLTGRKVTAGIRSSAVWPQYNDSHFSTGTEPADFETPNHLRIGPLFAWTFNTDPSAALGRPTLLVILGWYVDHPNRIGAVPYTLVAFTFSKDFLKK